MKRVLFSTLCFFMTVNSCSMENRFYKEEIPLGSSVSETIENDYSYSKIIIKEISMDEYTLMESINCIADYSGESKIRKYCSISLSFFDLNENEFSMNIENMKHAVGAPSTYHGYIFQTNDESQKTGVTLIARTTALTLLTSINEQEVSFYFLNFEQKRSKK